MMAPEWLMQAAQVSGGVRSRLRSNKLLFS